MDTIVRGWRFLLELYLGDHGFRSALVAYAVGFWIFGIGAVIFLIWPENPPPVAAFLRGLFTNIGLLTLVFMTYPVLRCSFRASDHTRPKSWFLRIMVPAFIGALSPLYLVMLIGAFVYFFAEPVITGG
jgi:hypothetical protein